MGERFNPYAVSLYEAGVRPVCVGTTIAGYLPCGPDSRDGGSM